MKSLIIKFKETQDTTEEGARFAGDGRFDSPGWSAKFCSYFVQVLYPCLLNTLIKVSQDLASRKVIALMVVCKNQVSVNFIVNMHYHRIMSNYCRALVWSFYQFGLSSFLVHVLSSCFPKLLFLVQKFINQRWGSSTVLRWKCLH